MATKTKEEPTQEVVLAKTKESAVTEVSLGGTVLSRDAAVEALKSMEQGEVDSGYLEMEPGESRRVVFVGWKNIPGLGENKDKEVPAAHFLTDTGKEQINADAVIVSYFQKQQVGVAREIQCTGVKSSPKGEYKTFKFYELNLKK